MNNNFHTPHLYKLREEQTPEVITRLICVPREGKFLKGETLTYMPDFRNQYSVEYIRKDGDRSWILKDGNAMMCYTYQLRR